MKVRWWLWVVLAIASCRSDERTTSKTNEPATGSQAATPSPTSQPDPWASTDKVNDDDAPSLAARHARTDKICPRVVKPYYYRVEKAGHTAYILGSRHIGVSVSKLPPGIATQFKAATLAVFETPPDEGSDSGIGKVVDLRVALGSADWKHFQDLVGKQSADSLVQAAPATAFLQMIAEFEDPTATLDIELEQTAQAAHIPTGGLESDAFQGDLLARLLDLRALRAEVEQTKDRGEAQSRLGGRPREVLRRHRRQPGHERERQGEDASGRLQRRRAHRHGRRAGVRAQREVDSRDSRRSLRRARRSSSSAATT